MAPKGPAHAQLESLDSVFGQEYFEQGRLVITVARDLPGAMKVAHKLQTRVTASFGAMVEVVMEHVKHAWWVKLHEATTSMGLEKGEASAVTEIPEGIRVHPYKRDHLPTLEVLLLWEKAGVTKGHCLSSTAFPEVPSENDIDRIFAEVEPFFAKRWLVVDLKLGEPIRGEFEDADTGGERPPHDEAVGRGALVTVLACHALGFARSKDGGDTAHVTECQPMEFNGVSDDAGRAKICFLPAEVNRLQVAETDDFLGFDGMIKFSELNTPDLGPTIVPVRLTPKALAGLTVHVFELPERLPPGEDGIIDWANEDRKELPDASVDLTPLKDGAETTPAKATLPGVFELSGLPEGCVTMNLSCGGYVPEEKTVILLVGRNEFYVPLKRN